MIRWLVAVIAIALVLPHGALAQEPAIAAAIVAGTCDDTAAAAVADLQSPIVSDGAPIGAASAQTAGTSYSVVPLSLQTLTGADHAITVTTGTTQTACGEIGGVPDSSGALAIVLTASAGGVGGIAYLAPVAADPATIGVSLFVGGSVLDGIDDASVARATEATPAAETPAVTESEPTTVPDVPEPTPESDADQAPTMSDDPGTRENPLPIGTAADIGGGWIVSVVEVNPNATEQVLAANMFNEPPEPGQQFVQITVSATYEGPEASSELPASNAFQVVGDSSVAYRSFDPGCGVIPNEMPRTEVFSGGTITGNVCFAVNSTDADSLVMFTEDFVTVDDDIRVWFALR